MRIIEPRAAKKPVQPREKKPELTQHRLMQVLHYNPDTGVFRWRDGIGIARAGDVAGTKKDDGRIAIGIDKKTLY